MKILKRLLSLAILQLNKQSAIKFYFGVDEAITYVVRRSILALLRRIEQEVARMPIPYPFSVQRFGGVLI